MWVTDLISPRGPIARNRATVAVGNALRKHNITDATIAGGHGTTAKQAESPGRAGGELGLSVFRARMDASPESSSNADVDSGLARFAQPRMTTRIDQY